MECRKPLSGRTDPVPWARICPARGLTTAVTVDQEGAYAAVTVYGAQGQRILRSPSAEAAAAVALPHSQVRARAACRVGLHQQPGGELEEAMCCVD